MAASRKFTKKTQAESYDKVSPREKEDGPELMKLLSIEKGSKVLDFGCGIGNLTKMLADIVGPEGQVVGIDPDVERLRIARGRFSASNLMYVEGSYESIPGKDYDIVFSNYVLHRCSDKKSVFQKMAQILKKGGKFGFWCGRYYDISKVLFNPIEAFSQELVDSYRNTLYLSTPDEFVSLASSSNFEIVHWSESIYKFKFDSVEELLEYYMTHDSGNCDSTHFNVDILKYHYKDGGVLSLPNLLAILVKK